MLPLDDRVVMISGANRGIGRAVAQRLHDGGARVSLGARRPAALAEATGSLDDHRSLRCRYDAADAGSDRAWVEQTLERFGRIDALVNNAGVLTHLTLDEGADDALDEMFEVNVKGPFRLIRLTLPHLRATGTGRVVNLSSLSGVRVANDEVGYSMTKFAVTALSHATRRIGWDDGVRVTNLCPGFVDTDMARLLEPGLDADTVIDPADLAELVATVLMLPNTASVAQLTVARHLESTV